MNSSRAPLIKLIPFFMLLVGGILDAGEALQIKPVDEAAKDPTFFVFRAKLIQAIARRDTAYLLSVIASDCSNGVDTKPGIPTFIEQWKPAAPDSEIWSELGKALSMGGKFEDGGKRFTAPYVSACFPHGLDGLENSVIVGEKVRLRKLPSKDAEIVGTLSWNIVKVSMGRDPDDQAKEWTQVTTFDGRTGYVLSNYVMSPAADWSAYFEYRSGKWVLTSLNAGC